MLILQTSCQSSNSIILEASFASFGGFFFLKYLFYVVFHIKTYRILHKKGMILKSILILFSKILQFSSFIIKQKINFLLLQISSSTYKDRNEEYKR